MKKNLRSLFCPSYLDFELPDDFLVEDISVMFKEDPVIRVLTERPLMGNPEKNVEMIEGSRFVSFDYDQECMHSGAKEFTIDFPIPLEDRRGVDIVFEYIKKNDSGCDLPFPTDIPVPEHGLPSNFNESGKDPYKLERFYCSTKGFVLYNPSVGCKVALGKEFPIVEDHTNVDTFSFTPQEIPVDGWFFSGYKDLAHNKPKMISLQYNPFHPMSASCLDDFVWETDTRLSGFYVYKTRRVPFVFDLNDARYRVNSIIWMRELPWTDTDGKYEMFDLVCETDFAHLFKFKEESVNIEPFVVEPLYMIAGKHPPFPYSYIGPFCKVARGVSDFYFSTYMRDFFLDETDHVLVREITQQVKLNNSESFLYEGKIYIMKDKEPLDKNFFAKVSYSGGLFRYRIFEKVLEKKGPGPYMHFIETNMKFLSYPKNVAGSIIYDIKVVTLLTAFFQKKQDKFHNYLPLWSPFHMYEDDDYNMHYEEPIEYGELDRHRSSEKKIRFTQLLGRIDMSRAEVLAKHRKAPWYIPSIESYEEKRKKELLTGKKKEKEKYEEKVVKQL
jgi:hypothetical protein